MITTVSCTMEKTFSGMSNNLKASVLYKYYSILVVNEEVNRLRKICGVCEVDKKHRDKEGWRIKIRVADPTICVG